MQRTDSKSPEVAAPILNLAEVSFAYGKREVLHNVCLQAAAGEIVTVLGHNGAGKTTLLRLAAGLLGDFRGITEVDGERVKRVTPVEMSRRGITYVEPQGVFPSLTIRENLFLSNAGSHRGRRDREKACEIAYTLFPDLARRRTEKAGSLSGGQRQMLAMGCGLARSPRVLLLDEPLLGLAIGAAEQVIDAVARLPKQENALAVVLVEQNIDMALSVASRATVLRSGTVVFNGRSKILLEAADPWAIL